MHVLRIARSCARIVPCRAFSRVPKVVPVRVKLIIPNCSRWIQKPCGFHTTRRCDIPPYLAMVIRPVIRLMALIFGRMFKKWWRKKSPEEKDMFMTWLAQKRNVFLGALGLYFFSLTLYYVSHLEIEPFTKRRQFILLNKAQQAVLDKITYDVHMEEHKDKLISSSDPVYTRLLRLTAKLISANRDIDYIREKRWTLSVINSPLKNAYVLPGGNIFIFLGALQMVENDDQLSIILAHEMAHALLHHSYEQVSRGIIIELLLALPIALLWAVFPDLLAGLFLIIGQSIIDVFHTLPYSRALENEADTVGLILAAKSCVDIRQAVVFWGLMRTMAELNIERDQTAWLSTHPDHGDREKYLNSILPDGYRYRSEAGCPQLSGDPRKEFYSRSKEEQLARFRKRGLVPS